jgi:peptidyl-prolyl cis-trans isomerase A (cyclophilin A)
VGDQIFATLHTSAGPIRVELFPNQAPKTVRNFVELAEGAREYTDPRTGAPGNGRPYYDGSVFHRVIDGFMIQGGDPTGTGTGGPGYQFDDEISELVFDRPYLLAMANAGIQMGRGTNGSQFFITVGPTPHLNRKHTIFGYVADPASQQVVNSIAKVPVRDQSRHRPVEDVVLERVEIERA